MNWLAIGLQYLNKGKLIREGTVKELTEKKHEYNLELENKIGDEVYLNLASQFNFAELKDEHYTALVNDISELNSLIDSLEQRTFPSKRLFRRKVRWKRCSFRFN